MSSQPRRPRGAPTGGQRVSQHKNPAQVSLNKDPSWPVVQYERLTWDPSFDLARLDVFERIKAERPYNSAVPPTIADQPVDLAPATAALAEQAAMEIVRFDAQMEALPVTMPAVLLRSESASSSQIEHLTASAKNIAVAEAGLRSTEHAELVTANSRAMMRALELDRPISADSILEIHRRLIEH